MSKAVISTEKLTAIADAIRAKNGGSDHYTPAQMADAIQAIPTGGGDDDLEKFIAGDPSSVQFDGETARPYAFAGLTPDTGFSVVAPNLTSLPTHAFDGTILGSMEFPKIVSDIKGHAFDGSKAPDPSKVPSVIIRFPALTENKNSDSSTTGMYYFTQFMKHAKATEVPAVLLSLPKFEGSILANPHLFGGSDSTKLYTFTEFTQTKDELPETNNVRVYAPKLVKLPPQTFYCVGSLTTVDAPNVTEIEISVFSGCSALIDVNLPAVTSLGASVFYGCSALEELNLPAVTTIGATCFAGCSKLKTLLMPNLEAMSGQTPFQACKAITSIDVPKLKALPQYAFGASSTSNAAPFTVIKLRDVESIATRAFMYLTNLKALVLDIAEDQALPTLANADAFNNCLIKTSTDDGFIYVTDSRVEALKKATNWITFADKIKPLSEYVEEE